MAFAFNFRLFCLKLQKGASRRGMRRYLEEDTNKILFPGCPVGINREQSEAGWPSPHYLLLSGKMLWIQKKFRTRVQFPSSL
jgi:hypothetical protein